MNNDDKLKVAYSLGATETLKSIIRMIHESGKSAIHVHDLEILVREIDGIDLNDLDGELSKMEKRRKELGWKGKNDFKSYLDDFREEFK